MQLSDLMQALAAEVPTTEGIARRSALAIVRALAGALQRGETVTIPGLGRFMPGQLGEAGGQLTQELGFVGKPAPAGRALLPGETVYLPRPPEQLAVEYYRASLEGRSHPDSWPRLTRAAAETWADRGRAAAAHLRPGELVADVGCGPMVLESLLPAGCRYLPIDIVARDERTLVVDLNAPDRLAFSADVICCLGVLEYLIDGREALAWLRERAPRMLLSFFPLVAGKDAGNSYWLTRWSEAELLDQLAAAGWRVEALERLAQEQLLLVLAAG